MEIQHGTTCIQTLIFKGCQNIIKLKFADKVKTSLSDYVNYLKTKQP